MKKLRVRILAIVSSIALAGGFLIGCGDGGGGGTSTPPVAQLYSQTNEEANVVVQMTRNTDGSLTVKNRYFTGGIGTNGVRLGDATNTSVPDSLVSQHSIIITPDKTTLYTVNAGNNTISTFSIDPANGNLSLKKVNATAGIFPTSLAYSKGFLYATFQGGSQQLQAYSASTDGSLTLIGAYALPKNGVNPIIPTQVITSPNGSFVIVSAGVASNEIVSYPVNANGTLGTPVSNTAGVVGPFAGEFIGSSIYITTDITDRALASYTFNNGTLTTITAPLTSGIAAPCWLSITPNGRYAYVGNGGGPISSYSVATNGALTLLNANAANEGIAVAGDSWISADGKYLYTAYLANDSVLAYVINADGSLTKVGSPALMKTVTGISMQGLVGF